jgi:hypothetical protein
MSHSRMLTTRRKNQKRKKHAASVAKLQKKQRKQGTGTAGAKAPAKESS